MSRILLLIDDEVRILHALERVFEDDGYLILTAQSAAEGLSLLAQHPVQVIISDQSMPEMTGAEFFKEVKSHYPETIRILLSAYTDFNALRDAINDGSIYKFINKPCHPDVLRKQVQEAFLVNAQQKQKENELIRLINYSKLSGRAGVSSLVTEDELQAALDNNQFVIYYQPILDANSQKIKIAEAVLRWQHPQHGLLQPDQFIPFSEERGFIVPMGAWVLRTACAQLKAWHNEGYTDLSLAVNVSAPQFNHPELLNLIREILLATQIPPSMLELEMTESLMMSNVEANIVVLQALRDLGLKLSLDDFGTGFSSLNYLKQFPIDVLKIDKSFIRDIASNQTSVEIVTAIITLAKSLGLEIIAEGIEQADQLEILKAGHCDLVQGYLFSKPVPAQAFSALLSGNLS